jgi:hypothetical protein
VQLKLGRPSQIIASGVTLRFVTPEAMTCSNDFVSGVK